MTASCRKHGKPLTAKDKTGLDRKAGIRHDGLSRMHKGKNIAVAIVGRICRAPDCTPDDIMEFSRDSQ